MALMLCFVSICSLHAESPYYKGYTDDLYYILSVPALAEDVPPTIVYNYKQGENCFIAGSILAGIGGFLVIPGILQMFCGKNIKQKQIGTGLLSAGSTLVGVSIPLLCFGDHIKKDANMAYEVWDILDYKIYEKTKD